MKQNRKSGFTLVEIMIVVAIIGLLAAIAVPSFLSARKKSQQKACLNNLRQISGAIDQYKLDNANSTPTLANLVGATAYIKATPVCPAGGTYSIDAAAGTASCAGATDVGTYTHSL